MNRFITQFVGNSNFTKEINSLVTTLSKNNTSVLLLGEKGSGKSFLAKHIHFIQNNCIENFFEINVKTVNKEKFETILQTVENLLKNQNEKSISIFVSSIDRLDNELQIQLLNLVNYSLKNNYNIRFICSSENSLESKVLNKEFNEQLFYKINNIVLNILPLRQRKEDILPIAQLYFDDFKQKLGSSIISFSENAKSCLINNFWKGNIDELINSIQRAFIVCQNSIIESNDLGLENSITANSVIEQLQDKSLKNAIDLFKKEYITKILEENNWNQTKTAKILKIQRTYVIRLMHELQIYNNN